MTRLVVVCGPPGVGKSTVAREVAGRLDARLLRTDAVRKDLYAAPDYTDRETDRVYATLLARAREALVADVPVVLDGTFRRATRREEVAALAEDVGVDVGFVRVECGPEVVRERVADREGLSDADVAVADQLREEYEPLARPHHTVDNSGDVAAMRRRVAALFGDDPT